MGAGEVSGKVVTDGRWALLGSSFAGAQEVESGSYVLITDSAVGAVSGEHWCPSCLQALSLLPGLLGSVVLW